MGTRQTCCLSPAVCRYRFSRHALHGSPIYQAVSPLKKTLAEARVFPNTDDLIIVPDIVFRNFFKRNPNGVIFQLIRDAGIDLFFRRQIDCRLQRCRRLSRRTLEYGCRHIAVQNCLQAICVPSIPTIFILDVSTPACFSASIAPSAISSLLEIMVSTLEKSAPFASSALTFSHCYAAREITVNRRNGFFGSNAVFLQCRNDIFRTVPLCAAILPCPSA